MISKFWPKKTGNFANYKHSDHVDESKISPSGKEDESKYLAKEEVKGKRTSSKFYVEIDGDSVGGASDLSLNSVSPTASESCLNGDVMSSTDSADTDGSCSVPLKPELKPKPKISSPLLLNRLPVPGAVPERTSPCAVKPPASPVKIQVCPRASCFPPPWPPSPRQELIRSQENEQNDRAKQSSEVVQPMRNVKREPMRAPVSNPPGSNHPGSTPLTNRRSRSGRRSFTTDDADIGLYKKPSFSPELSPLPDSAKSKPVILRHGKGSEVSSRVDLFERLTCTRSRSFSNEKSSANQAEQESRLISSKPKPPTKPKSSNLSPDWKTVSPSKPSPVLNERSATKAEEKIPDSPALPVSHPPLSSSDGKQHAHLKAPERSKASSDESPSPKLGEIDAISTNENYDREMEFSDDEFSFSDENESGDENRIDKAAQELAPIEKAKKVAEELLKTEEAYVGRLKLLDEIFHTRILHQNREENFIPQEVIPQMFSNIKSILLFHNDFLLPQLRSCMEEWGESVARVGQVMKKFAPFLKMYAGYVKNFAAATSLITLWIQRSPGFARCLDEIQRQPECGCLTLQHHLLEPIQRVPRYELLLRDYIKNLPEESEDRIHASEALVLVTRAAEHSNMEMRKIEKFRGLLDLNDALGGALDLVDPTRELIKEGKITKISARDGDHLERYLFLFNDMLIVCQSLPLKQLGLRQQQYVVKSKLDIRGMQVLQGNNPETAHTFMIKSKQKSIEFCGGTEELKEEWQKALWSTISDFTKKEQSRNADANILIEFQEKGLGKRAPVWVKDQETTMCMTCGERFGTFKRRHHCRCCGKVVCNKCSAYKAKLSYNDSGELRVCAHCSTALGLIQAKMSEEKSALNKTRAVLKTSAANPSVLSGYLNLSRNRKNWTRKFIAIHSDFVLYSFKAHQDVIAQMSLPLPGCDISKVEKCEDIQMKDFVFCISQKPLNKFYYFQADDESQRKRWIEVLLCTTVAELPKNVSSCPMPKVEIKIDEVPSSPSTDSSRPLTDEPAFDVVSKQKEDERPSE